MKYSSIFLFFMILCAGISSAQITPVVSGNKDKILIGEPITLTFEVKAIDPSAKITWNFPDSIEHFEYLGFDTIDILKREITFTSWDSGIWLLKGISVTVPSNLNDKPQTLQFAPKEIMVEYDTTGSRILNDIKPIMEVSAIDNPWIAYSILAAAIITLFLLVYLFKKWKAKQSGTEIFEPVAGAYEEFMKVINDLKQRTWATQQEQKAGFSELTAAAKRFLERNYRQPYSKYTTDETIFHLAPVTGRETAAQLTQVMRLADAVKFAKFAAPQQECSNAVLQIEKIVQQIQQQTV
ncbi:MAG: hypothetical protein KGZ74_15145 [Chitinophagaceae bacterium]|nr:hypothetical protein [Chitinophagaceae bacterium]